MYNDLVAYTCFSEKLNQDTKKRLVQEFQPSIIQKIKWLFVWTGIKNNIGLTEENLLSILDQYNTTEHKNQITQEDKDQIIEEYESYKIYKEEMQKQAELWPAEFDTIKIPKLSDMANNKIKIYAYKYHLPLRHLQLMAWVTKEKSQSKSSWKFINTLNMLQNIAKKNPSLWIDIVKLYILSYTCKNISDLFTIFMKISSSKSIDETQILITQYVQSLEEAYALQQEKEKMKKNEE